MSPLSNDSSEWIRHISDALWKNIGHEQFVSLNRENSPVPTAVLLLIAPQRDESGPCLILNKRSRKVRQPGDICCPGGSISPRIDSFIGKLLTLPGGAMTRGQSLWQKQYPAESRSLAILLATALRESFEEMRLNPFGVRFLGPLAPQQLQMFRRVIYPMAAWVHKQKRFRPNWEVEKVIRIPLRDLIRPDYYARYRLRFAPGLEEKFRRKAQDFPCFLYPHQGEYELLWGATYRIVTAFLQAVLGFEPPDMAALPVIYGVMDGNYLRGVRSEVRG